MKKTGSTFKRNAVWFIAAIALLISPTLSHGLMTAGAQAEEKEIYKPTGQEGTITGTIIFHGKAPKRESIDVSQDDNCLSISRDPKTEHVIVKDGKLANVFVYVKSGGAVDDYRFETPATAVELAHKECRYIPHVLGLQTGQTLRVINADPGAHNTHPSPKMNVEWNRSQAAEGAPIEQKFKVAETFIPFKDNQHPWEKAYVSVLSHPFFAVSDERGKYTIEGIPPGTYTIAAWHEKYGEQTTEIIIVARDNKSLDFTFKAE